MIRIKRVRLVITILFCALIARVAWLSTFDGGQLAKMAVAQRSETIPMGTSRGIIYDRNMLPLTHGQTALWAAIVPGKCENIEAVKKILGKPISGNKVQLFPLQLTQDEQTKLFSIKGVIRLNIANRYMNDGILSHVIGYHSENGSFGVEGAMNSFLDLGADNNFVIVKSAEQKAISGLGMKLSEQRNHGGIRLTIDYHIQEICEKVVDEKVPLGAVVVAEISTGNILAMASRPNFTQDQLAEYLSSTRGDLINRAIEAYDIGSVFKIVVTAAALSEGLINPQDPVYCGGVHRIADTDFVCNKKEGHGNITFSQAFAYSCNIPFYQLGQQLGIKKIYEYADRLGFGRQVLNINLNEKTGNIPSSPYTLPGEVANVSIGQGAVQVTPLQVANMLCTIADGGYYKQMSLADSIVSTDGVTLAPLLENYRKSIIKKDVADDIMNMLISAVQFGTGTAAQIANEGGGGKTSSAETGWIEDGEVKTHGWFAGFFPEKEPKYVCVVLSEDGKRGGTSAAPVFKQIGEEILAYTKKF